MADHGEQRLCLALAVDDPVAVEDLVAAVLRIGLREHGQLCVARIAPHRPVGLLEVLDLVLAEGEAEIAIGLLDIPDWNEPQRPWRYMLEEPAGRVKGAQH